MTRCFLIVTIFGGIALTGARQSAAQSNTSVYTSTQLGAIRNQNSVGAYSQKNLRTNVYNSSVPRYSFSSVNRNLFSSVGGSTTTSARAAKPFGSVNRGSGPTPWLSLSDPYASTAHNYYSQVRPQLEQQRASGRMANHAQQGASMSESPPFDPQGNASEAPTGHVATYMNWGGYYTPTRPTKAPARQ